MIRLYCGFFLFLYRFELIVGTDEKKKERKKGRKAQILFFLHENTPYIRECPCIKLYYAPQYKGKKQIFLIYSYEVYILKHGQTSKIIICTCKRECRYRKEIHIYETYIRKRVSFYYGLYCHLLHIQSKECVIEIFALSFISFFFFLFLSLYRGILLFRRLNIFTPRYT